MLIKIAVVVLVGAAALAGFIASRPAEFRIARSRSLSAPPEVVHAYVNDFHTWTQWSPWEKFDPGMKRELSGPPAGVGASYAWAGNKNIGEGRMTIIDSAPGERVTIRLEFLTPFAATNTAQFDFARSGPGTTVTWSMAGRNDFMAKAIGLFMNMDTMIGGEFEKGLASLDTVTATAASKSTGAAIVPARAAAPRS